METAERRRETGGILCFQNPAGEAVDDPGLGGAMLIASAARRVPRAPGSQYERRTRPRRRTRSKLRPEPRLKQRSGAVSARPRDRPPNRPSGRACARTGPNRIGRLDRVADPVCKRCPRHLARIIRLLGRPVPKARSEAVRDGRDLQRLEPSGQRGDAERLQLLLPSALINPAFIPGPGFLATGRSKVRRRQSRVARVTDRRTALRRSLGVG